MKIHIDLMLVIRQMKLAARIHLENVTPLYVTVLKLFLQVVTLAITLNLDTILTVLGA